MIAVVIPVIPHIGHHGPLPLWASLVVWPLLAIAVAIVIGVCIDMWRHR